MRSRSPSPGAVGQPNQVQEAYSRARKNPFFDGLLRAEDGTPSPPIDLQASLGSRNISRTMSDIGNTHTRNAHDSLTDIGNNPFLQPFERSKIGKTASFAFTDVQSLFSFDPNEPIEANEKPPTVNGLTSPTSAKSFRVNRRKENLSTVSLPQSAASFYNGDSPEFEIVASCPSINKLNSFLKATKDEVNAGVPGRFLHVVMAQDGPDVGSIASTITYAFYLNEARKSDQICTVPVINMKRLDIRSQAELKWLLDSCQIDQSSLIFVDEIDLSYYDLFGSLKVVLLNGNKLPAKQEALKQAVVEIFNCKEGESVYPWVKTITIAEKQDSSCCTLVAEKFALISPEILAGQGFSRLLLAAILLDSANLCSPQCSLKDKYMATLLIHGSGRFGCNGLYQLLRYKMYDVSDLKVADILRKDFKKWTRVGKPDSAGSRMMASQIGMSSIGVPIAQLLDHEDTSVREIKYFQYMEKIRLLMIVSGYYDSKKNFKREILVSAESVELMKNLLFFFNASASQLPLKAIHQPGLGEEMQAFEIDKVTSRKTIERLLEEFGGTSKG
ncbi:exopolyphosphatase PRUNE1-like isoform X1 [Prunus avium]|uniref:Exopolyphosphatase PRUNE1-like isoform X1 n=1 Tax=Prunus avium TaxID=42229 RepID=A0A6P5T9D4_PRUAV|nr:exopolyphosphatase PRUNE1-like isoform X1 [Prunus avium]